MFSVYILTYNEEVDIAACIESALECDDIILIDSCSTDKTVEIASQYPIRIFEHKFETHGKQRNWMLENIDTKYDWVYLLEADERLTPELFMEISTVVKEEKFKSYYAAEKMMFMGKWIKYSTQYPRHQMRLFKKGEVSFIDYGHTEREVCKGESGYLVNAYPHFTCSKGLSRWLEKHNRYSSDEAAETLRQIQKGKVNWHNLFLGETEVIRRRALKDLSLRLPFRPLSRWFYMYFILRGILDGKAGFAWCTLQAFYEYLILLKVEELQRGIYADSQSQK